MNLLKRKTCYENLFFKCCLKLYKLVKNDTCRCKIEHKTTRNKRSSGCILQIIIRSTFKTSDIMSYSWEMQKKTGGWGHTFQKIPLEFFIYWLYPRKFKSNQSSTHGNFTKLCYISIENSTTKNQDPWKFHIIFSWSPSWKFLVLFLWYS